MYRAIEQHLRNAIKGVREEAQHRRATTPSDVAAEAFDNAASRFETAINEAMRETERLTPSQYAEVHRVTPQTVTRWIRLGELEAVGDAATGYLISRDAKRTERRHAS